MADNADRSTGEAADAIIGRLAFQIVGRNASATSLTAAVPPAYGLTWRRSVLTRCDADRLNGILARMGNSKLPGLEYDRLANFWKNAYVSPLCFPIGGELMEDHIGTPPPPPPLGAYRLTGRSSGSLHFPGGWWDISPCRP